MWLLKKLNQGNVFYLVSEKHCYVVGRKNCDIILEEDASVSRKHCTIFVAEKSNCNFEINTSTGIWIVDANSKYGTFLKKKNEWEKLNAQEERKLGHSSIIRFGLMDNIWSVQYAPTIACTSGIQFESKKNIISELKKIDGQLKNSWSNECNLMIVSQLTLTVKVVLALINGIPIVRLEYLNKLVEAVRSQMELPLYKDYKPVISESILDASLVSLDHRQTRKELFKDRIFVFPTSRQLEILKEVITNAGGKATLLNYNSNWSKFADKRVTVIQLPSNKSNISEEAISNFEKLTKYLQLNHNKKVIPESDIAQAIAYSSIEKYCNDVISAVCAPVTAEETQDLGAVLIEETPEIMDKVIPYPYVVPCSSTGDTQEDDMLWKQSEVLTRQKRYLSPDPHEPLSKIPKSESKITGKQSESITIRGKSKSTKEFHNQQPKENSFSVDKNYSEKSTIPNYFKKICKSEPSNDLTKDSDNDIVAPTAEERPPEKEILWNEIIKAKHKSSEELSGSKDFWDSGPTGEAHIKRKCEDNMEISEETPSKKLRKPMNDKTKRCFSPDSGLNRFEVKPKCDSENKFPEKRRKAEEKKEEEFSEDFVEINKTVCNSDSSVNRCDYSMFSINLISSLYLNDDGSLINPPEVPVNVKKFKKQKVCLKKETYRWEDKEDDLSGDGWLEVHPLNASKSSPNEKYAW